MVMFDRLEGADFAADINEGVEPPRAHPPTSCWCRGIRLKRPMRQIRRRGKGIGVSWHVAEVKRKRRVLDQRLNTGDEHM